MCVQSDNGVCVWQSLTFPDMWCSRLEGSDYLQVNAVCNQGKTLACGHVQHAACWRHKDPLKCPVSHLAWLLFWRLHATTEEFPDYTYRHAWYFRRVLAQENNRNGKLPDSTYDRWIKWAYEGARIPAPKIALLKRRHTGRKWGSGYLQRISVSRDDIGSHCGWAEGKIYNFAYLFQVDQNVMKVAAGHDIATRTDNILYPRTDSMDKAGRTRWAKTIFHMAEVWQPLIAAPVEDNPQIWSKPGADKSRMAVLHFNDLLVCATDCEPPMFMLQAAGRTLTLCFCVQLELRKVLVEDFPWFFEAYPNHAMWTHYPFSDESFRKWALDNKERALLGEQPSLDVIVSRMALSHADTTIQLLAAQTRELAAIRSENASTMAATAIAMAAMQHELVSLRRRLEGARIQVDEYPAPAQGVYLHCARQSADARSC